MGIRLALTTPSWCPGYLEYPILRNHAWCNNRVRPRKQMELLRIAADNIRQGPWPSMNIHDLVACCSRKSSTQEFHMILLYHTIPNSWEDGRGHSTHWSQCCSCTMSLAVNGKRLSPKSWTLGQGLDAGTSTVRCSPLEKTPRNLRSVLQLLSLGSYRGDRMNVCKVANHLSPSTHHAFLARLCMAGGLKDYKCPGCDVRAGWMTWEDRSSGAEHIVNLSHIDNYDNYDNWWRKTSRPISPQTLVPAVRVSKPVLCAGCKGFPENCYCRSFGGRQLLENFLLWPSLQS